MQQATPLLSGRHIPVLLPEVVSWLAPRPGGWYLDGTLGLGGHAEGILEAGGGACRLVGLDRDSQALDLAEKRLARFGAQVTAVQARFSEAARVLKECGAPLLDGALVDIGVSSMQLDEGGRGFSFIHDGPLDMRMDAAGGSPGARELVNRAPFASLQRILSEYGEEPLAGKIARAIVDARQRAPIATTLELAEVVAGAYPPKWRATARNHPATRTFQALRIAVNDELGELKAFLRAIPGLLKPGARLCVISFHSLEDRLVKNAIRDESRGCVCPPQLARCMCGHARRLAPLTRKPVVPSPEETAANPRAASARLRVAERVGEA